MGFMDKIKGMMKQHDDKVDDGIDAAAKMADEKTDGQYSEHIETGAEKAKDVVDGLTEEE